VVCCVNSLPRVPRDQFDIVIVDEPNKMLRSLAGWAPAQRPFEILACLLSEYIRLATLFACITDAYAHNGHLVQALLESAGAAAACQDSGK
jgi:hypothetical protein